MGDCEGEGRREKGWEIVREKGEEVGDCEGEVRKGGRL